MIPNFLKDMDVPDFFMLCAILILLILLVLSLLGAHL